MDISQGKIKNNKTKGWFFICSDEKKEFYINRRIVWSTGEMFIPNNFHFNEEKSSISKISFSNSEFFSSDRLEKEKRFH